MTALPSQPSLTSIGSLVKGPEENRAYIDGLVRRHRLQTPPEITEQRAIPRVSVEELNSLDLDTIRERFLKSRRDDRGPITRFLDLLDLPRNAISNVIFPGAARQSAERGDRAAFGLPRVMFSDALANMGVENRIVRGVIGFVGDVALDPLTYLGPAGFGIKVAGKGGRGVEIGLRGRRELLGAVNAVRKSGRLDTVSRETAELLGSFGITNERLARRAARGQTNEQLAEYVSRRALGSVTPTGGRVGEALARVGGTTEFTAGGAFRRFGEVVSPERMATATGQRRASQIAAVDQFVRRYGKGRNPALRVGRAPDGRVRVGFNPDIEASSTIAHVPFTEIGLLNVPAFTPAARSARVTQTIAKADKAGVEAFQTAETARVNALGSEIEELTGTQARLDEERVAFARRHQEIIDDWESGDPDRVARAAAATESDGLTPTPDDARVRLDRGMADFDLQIQNTQAEIQSRLDEMRRIATEAANRAAENPNEGNVGSLLATRELVREASEKAGWYAAKQAELGPIRRRAEAIREIEEGVERSVRAEERLSDLQAVERGSQLTIGRRFLSVDEATGETLVPIADGVRSQVARQIEPLLDEIDEVVGEIRQASQESRPGLFAGRVDDTQPDAAQFSADSLEGLRDRLDDLLDDLEDLTAPLRELPRDGLQTLDEAREAARAQRVENLNDALREVVELSDESAAARLRLADAVNTRMEANFRLAHTARAGLASLMDSSEKHARDVLKAMLDIDDDVIGASLLSSMRALTTDAFGLRDENAAMAVIANLDGGIRRVFGQRSGYLHEMARVLKNTMTEGQRQDFIRVAEATRDGIRRALREAGKTDEWIGDNIDRAERLIMALAIDLRNRQAADAGRPLRYPMFKVSPRGGGPPELSAFAAVLQLARNDGWFQDEKLIGALRAIAEENVHIIDRLGEVELDDLILGTLRSDHIPNTPTLETTRLIAEANRRAGRGEAAGGTREVLEQFQKARTTDRFRFVDSTGAEVEFLHMERGIAALPDEVVRQMPEEAQRRIIELRRIIGEFDALPEQPPALATDPFEFNDMAHRGVFSLITGRTGEFMDTSISTAMASRIASHQRAVARRNWGMYIQNFGLAINREELKRVINTPGAGLRLADGREVKIGDRGVVLIGGERWRLLNDRTQIHNPVMQLLGDGNLNGFLYHEVVADKIEAASRLFSDDESINTLLQSLEAVTRAWKSVTLLHPSWTIMNVVGDGLNAIAGGARVADVAKHALNAVKMVALQRDPERLRQIVFNVRGQQVNGEQLLEMLTRHRVTETNLYAETAMQAVARGMVVLPSMVSDPNRNLLQSLRNPRRAANLLRADVREAAQHYAIARNAESASLVDQLRGVHAVAGDRAMRTVFGPWFRVNQKVSDSLRAVTFLSHLEQGSDPATAAMRTIRSLFDYTDVTNVESKGFRLLFPFYSFMRNNMVYQMKLLFERPIFAGSVPLVQNAIEELIAGDEQVPMHMRPNWMREAVAVQMGADPDTRNAVLLSAGTPIQDALTVGSSIMGVDGFQDFLHYFVSGINPVLRAPLEIGTRREFFSGREIGPNQFEGDVTVGQFLGSQLRPVREAAAIRKAAADGGVAGVAGRALMGGRVQRFNDERLRVNLVRQFQDEERRIRIARKRAVNDGDRERAMGAQIRLLQLYNRMVEAGLGDEVPRWAQSQLSSLDSPAPAA